MNKQEKLAFLTEANKSTYHWGAAFHPEAFYDPFCPAIHGPMLYVLEAPAPPGNLIIPYRKAVAAPRGIGKSTLGNTMNLERRACMGYNRYMLIYSYTLDQAKEHLHALDLALTTNDKIHEVFGDVKGPTWNEEVLVLKNGCKIKAVGFGQQIRGRREGFDRPDYALGDDFESNEAIESPTIMERMRRWRKNDLRNSLHRHMGEDLLLGTILGLNSILQEDLASPNVLSVRLELFDEEYRSWWPEVYSNERIEVMRREAVEENNLDGLWQDYRNIAVAQENASFSRSMFRYWQDLPGFDWRSLQRFVIADPAKTNHASSCKSAVAVLGARWSGEVFVLDYVEDRMTQYQLYDWIAHFCREWEVNWVYPEANGLNDYITDPLRNYLRSLDPPVLAHVEPLIASGLKEDRVANMAPKYKAGMVYHNKEKAGLLEERLLTFPKPRFWDLLDCIGHVQKVMAIRNIGFAGKNAEIYTGDPKLLSRRILS